MDKGCIDLLMRVVPFVFSCSAYFVSCACCAK